ncbi:MAG: SWIM zinc finger family protein [Anaerolineae bacterium]
MDTSLINKIQKAKEYAGQPERVTFSTLSVEFQGDNSTYDVHLGPDGWSCSCPGYSKYGICPHIMTLEKIYKPMLAVSPVPYALGQNIVSDVRKAQRYSEEQDRITIKHFEATFAGDNKDHHISYDDGVWNSTSSYFKTHGIGAYTMTMERILEGRVKPIRRPATEVSE